MTSADRTVLGWAIASWMGAALACASTPNPTVERVRENLRSAETDPAVANDASVELYEAKQSFERLEAAAEGDIDADENEHIQHLAYVTEQRIQIARAAASEEALSRQSKELAEQRDEQRLSARTSEAELANARADELEARLEALKAEKTERGLVITMGQDVLFAFDSAQLQPGAQDALDEVAELLNEYPEREIAVEGHTDNVGSDAYNESLSRARANAVASHLEREGVPQERIEVAGFGEQKPVAPNDNEAGRQQNRRVEIVIENPRPAVSSAPR